MSNLRQSTAMRWRDFLEADEATMRSWFWRGTLAAAIALTLSGAAWAQVPNVGCSNATLNGDYASGVQGEYVGILDSSGVVHPFESPIPINGVVMQHFDGEGNFTQVDFFMQDGTKRPGATISTGFDGSEKGPYTVNPDCTGNFEIDAGSGPAEVIVKVMFVLARQGTELHGVVKALHVPAAPPAADNTMCVFGTGCDLAVQVRADGSKLGNNQ